MAARPSGVVNRQRGFQNIGLLNPVFIVENSADNSEVTKSHPKGGDDIKFSIELVWSQSTFSTDPKVLQNFAGFTLCSSAGLEVGNVLQCDGFDNMLVVCTDLLCDACIGLLPRLRKHNATDDGNVDFRSF